jgi:hypothetical protein
MKIYIYMNSTPGWPSGLKSRLVRNQRSRIQIPIARNKEYEEVINMEV